MQLANRMMPSREKDEANRIWTCMDIILWTYPGPTVDDKDPISLFSLLIKKLSGLFPISIPRMSNSSPIVGDAVAIFRSIGIHGVPCRFRLQRLP